jgi:hypothetical protein
MATNSSLAEELATELGEAYKDPEIQRQFKQWVSECVEMILAAARWPFATGVGGVTTSADTRTYELGAGHGDVRIIQEVDQSTTLPYFVLEELQSQGFDIRQTGKPVLWYYDALSDEGYLVIGFWPVPDAAYSYHIYRDTVNGALDDSADVTIPLPADFLQVIRDGVRALYRENTENAALAQLAWQRYTQKLGLLRDRYLSPQAGRFALRAVDLPAFTLFDRPRLPSDYP